MSKFRIDGPPDAAKELEALLRHNDIAHVREPDGAFRFLFSQDGFKWETLCRATDDGAVLVYGIYPFPVEPEAARAACEEINARLRFGAMFVRDGRAVCRTGADLFDVFSAYECIGRALEYNAGAMVEFKSKLAACQSGAAEDKTQRTDPGGSE